MSDDEFRTTFTIESQGSSQTEIKKDLLRRVVELLRPPFILQKQVRLMVPEPTQLGLIGDPTASSLAAAPDLSELQRLTLDIDALAGDRSAKVHAASIEVRFDVGNIDPTAVPWILGHHVVWIDWQDEFCYAHSFKRPEFRSAYAGLMKSIRKTLRPRWLADGHFFSWDADEPRFTFYRVPEEFARSLMLRFSVQGNEKDVVKALRGIEERDALTRRIHKLKRNANETEARDPLVGRYKRLRFPTEGGVILEDGRFGVHDSVAYGRTADDASATLVQLLVESGVVRPTASIQEKPRPRERGGPTPRPPSGPPRPWE